MHDMIRRNQKCFVGMPACDYVYESAKMCFVACPSDDKYALQVDVINDIVESRHYECHVALKRIDPATFAFCTKICSKIIQSQFCIVLLDPSINDKGQEFPNPNVHMEYGMMISQNKRIIPLHNEGSVLAFNVSPLDTIKYTQGNFKQKVTEAVEEAIKAFSDHKVPGQTYPVPEITTFYNLQGYNISDITVELNRVLYELGGNLGFFLFDCRGKYRFVGPFSHEHPRKTILHTKVLIDKITATYESLVASSPEEASKGTYDYLLKNISVDIIVPSIYRKEDILGRIRKVARTKYDYTITAYHRSDIDKKVEEEYKCIGEIEPVR